MWGEHALRQARAAIVRALEDQGYHAKDRNGLTVFRPPESWMGKVSLTRDGELIFGRPVLALRGVGGAAHTWDPGASVDAADAAGTAENLDQAWSAEQAALNPDPGLTSQAVGEVRFYALPSGDVLAGVRQRVLETVDDEIVSYQAILRETRLRETLYALPDQLDRLWTTGEAPDGTAKLATPEERRAWVLEYWATRAETPEGYAVCGAVEKWLRATVMDSESPVTEAEWRSASARRADGRVLDLGGQFVP